MVGMAVFDRLWRWSPESRVVRKALEMVRPDVLLVNEVNPLPVCLAWAQSAGCPTVVDLHEYYPETSQAEDYVRLDKPAVEHLLRTASRKIAAAVTVNEPIAERYEKEFGFRCGVIYNAEDLAETPVFRPVDCERPMELVHIGVLQQERQPLEMVKGVAMAGAQWHLHFYLVGAPGALEAFRSECARLAPGQVTVHDPLAPGEITGTIRRHDVGISVIPPVNWNWLMAAPNKFFSFVAAGLGMVLGPKPWKQMMSERYGFAELTNGFAAEDIAALLGRLTPERINEMKRCSAAAAVELSGTVMGDRLLEICERARTGSKG